MSIPMTEHIPDQESQHLLLEEGVLESCEHVAGMLITGSKFFTLGMRGFYFSIPFVFYYFGPLALLLSTLATLGFMYAGDSSLGAQKIGRNCNRNSKKEDPEISAGNGNETRNPAISRIHASINQSSSDPAIEMMSQ
jgi:hypothetical protein